MARNPNALPLLNLRKDNLDKWAYFLAVFAGMAMIVYLRFIGTPAIYVAGVPIGLILAYALIALTSRGLQLREDRIADNCYYLGFIYTLTSLAYALWNFQSGGLITDKLIQDFGVALISTIAGVIARLLLNQLRADPVEVEQSARMTLAEASENLKAEMISATTDFETFRTSLHQSFEEAQKEMMGTVRVTLETSAQEFSNVTKGMLDDTTKTFRRHQKSSDKIETASEEAVSRLEHLVRRIDEIEAPKDLLTTRLAPAVTEIERATTAIRERSEAEGGRIERASQAVEKVLEAARVVEAEVQAQSLQVNTVTTLYSRIAESMEPLTDDINALSTFARRLGESFSDIQKVGALSKGVLEEVERHALGAVANLKKHNEGLAIQLTESRKMTGEVQATLVELAESMTRRLNQSHQVTVGERSIVAGDEALHSESPPLGAVD